MLKKIYNKLNLINLDKWGDKKKKDLKSIPKQPS